MNAAPRKKNTGPRRIQSLEVGFRVIRALEAGDGYKPLKEIAAAVGMLPSKAYFYLVSFIHEGMVHQDPATGYYGLGPFAVHLGLSAIRQLDIVALAREELRYVRQVTRCAAYLSVWGNRGPAIVSKLDGDRQGSLSIRIGYVLPVVASATGQVFYTYLPEGQTAPVIRQQARDELARPFNPLGPAEVAKIPSTVRRRGYATTAANINTNFVAFAAPLFDHSGEIAAALTVLGSAPAMKGELRKTIVKTLLTASNRLSDRPGAKHRDLRE